MMGLRPTLHLLLFAIQTTLIFIITEGRCVKLFNMIMVYDKFIIVSITRQLEQVNHMVSQGLGGCTDSIKWFAFSFNLQDSPHLWVKLIKIVLLVGKN